MKNLKLRLALAVAVFSMAACTSDGTKWGTLQKVSHKSITDTYVAEIAFQGGRAVSDGKNNTYENTQEFAITKEQFEEMSKLLGKSITIKYADKGVTLVGPSKYIISYDYVHDDSLTGEEKTSKIPEE